MPDDNLIEACILRASRKLSPQGSVAEWLCSGLQIRLRRFDSDPSLHYFEK